jgi:hypothetical protein
VCTPSLTITLVIRAQAKPAAQNPATTLHIISLKEQIK